MYKGGTTSTLSLFAGSDEEDGSNDGPVKESRYKQPVGICSEFKSVVYVCDAQTNSMKVCTNLKAHTFSKQLAAYTKRFLCITKVYVILLSVIV